jgi:hypothetical protein
MKMFTVVTGLLLLNIFVSAQAVSPSSVNFGEVVVGQTSPAVSVAFTNTGDSDLTLTISITGPFAIPVNHCGRGVKVGTHCNVDVTYTPVTEETDTGTLIFNYGEGTVSVSLTGTGVSTTPPAPTKTKLTGPHDVGIDEAGNYLTFYAIVTSNNGTVPDGEMVYFKCENSRGGGFGDISAPIENSLATLYIYVDQYGTYDCSATYPGDSQFQASVSNKFDFYSYYAGGDE